MWSRQKVERVPINENSKNNYDKGKRHHHGIKRNGVQYEFTVMRKDLVNFKLMAIKIGDSLSFGADNDRINLSAKAIFPFKVKKHPNKDIHRLPFQTIYDWIMTLSEQTLSLSETLKLLSSFTKEVAPDFNLLSFAQENSIYLQQFLEKEAEMERVISGFATKIANKRSQKFNKVKMSKDSGTVRKVEDVEKSKLSDSKNVFVLMPFGEPFQTIYYNVISPVVKSLGYSASKADEDSRIGIVIDQIKKSIREAFLIIADVTGKNPNVFYELGLAHGSEKEVLIITQTEKDIPFDISHIRHFKYTYDPNFDDLKKQFHRILKENLEAISNDK